MRWTHGRYAKEHGTDRERSRFVQVDTGVEPCYTWGDGEKTNMEMDMTSKQLQDLVVRVGDIPIQPGPVNELRVIIMEMIDHMYFRQLDHEQDRGLSHGL